MNSFALLQDDVEDATDLSANVDDKAKAPDARPAEAVQDARAARDERKPEVRSAPPVAEAESAVVDGEVEDTPPPPPKEKDLTLEEYLAQKAQKSSNLTSLSKGIRKANDGKNSGFEKMSVLKKDDPATAGDEDSLMGSVAFKEVHENKALKDSTHAAVAKNAEIQSFFKKEPAGDRRPYNSGPRRGGDFRRGAFDSKRGGRGGGRGFEDRGKSPDDRGGRYDGRGGRFEGRGGRPEGRGGKFEGRGGRFEVRGGRNERGMDRDFRRDQRGGYGRGNGGNNDGPNGLSQGGPRSYGNGPKVPMAPNVDDTAAFPSL